MDAVQKANSGHPGTPMALAPLAHVLFTRVLRHDPSQPHWPDRDRFILSNGHASMLLYSMLYLNGYGLTLDDIKQFRQWGSRTPGHPEVHVAAGIEVTTGPLGQGFANGVGMGVAERFLRAHYGPGTINHHIFVFCGDGDLMEGISHEAASLAGKLGLGRLVYVFDDNHITIDGSTDLATVDDALKRFEAYGWHVERLGEVANDLDALEAGLRRGMAEADRPSLLSLRSHIGWPSPHRTDTKEAHGEALGVEEVRLTKGLLGLPEDQDFYVPDEVPAFYRECARRGEAAREAWEQRQAAVSDEDRVAFEACLSGRGLDGWAGGLPSFEAGTMLATRKAINKCLTATQPRIPGIIAGAGDLTGNTGVDLGPGAGIQSHADPGGRQLHYGIREHGMVASMTGMALHGGVLPVGGTFFVFSDYARGAIRLAALVRSARDLFLHPRLDRARRGRPDPSAHRAARLATGHAGTPLDPPGRCQGDLGRLADRRRLRRPDGARAEPPGAPRAGRDDRRHGRRRRARCLRPRARRQGRLRARPGAHRHRQRGSALPRRRQACWSPTGSPFASSRSRAGICSPRRRRRTEMASCRPACPGSRSRRARPSAGTATPTRRCRSTATARLRREQ